MSSQRQALSKPKTVRVGVKRKKEQETRGNPSRGSRCAGSSRAGRQVLSVGGGLPPKEQHLGEVPAHGQERGGEIFLPGILASIPHWSKLKLLPIPLGATQKARFHPVP